MEQRRGAIAQPPPVSYHRLCGITEEHHKQSSSAQDKVLRSSLSTGIQTREVLSCHYCILPLH